MKLVNWVRFSWDLTKLPPLDCELPEHYEIAPASREDEVELRKVISRSIVLDATWNPAMQEVMQTINAWLDEAFASPTSIFLALRHGTRIIGAAARAGEGPMATSLLRKIKECAVYAKKNGLGYLEASGVVPPEREDEPAT
jgi:hypothetical protein